MGKCGRRTEGGPTSDQCGSELWWTKDQGLGPLFMRPLSKTLLPWFPCVEMFFPGIPDTMFGTKPFDLLDLPGQYSAGHLADIQEIVI